MTKERYTRSGEYYIQDNTLHKKISNTDTIHILNRQEQIIRDKSDTITTLLNLQGVYEKRIKELEEDVEYYKKTFKKLIG
ncbi:hypothetical protein [Methanobrevibacter sp.]|uniref:hypothetical protein n=1 Tax=Methanobrevibacter sp. TaxID=66852 RepID=UPI0038674784